MRQKLLICVSALQATVAYWRAGKIAQMEQFERDERGLAALREFLAPHPNVPVYVMVDAVEEDYRFETLPHSWGSERAQMVARKLKQHYRNTPYVGAWLQGREQGKRRDDRYLFSALTNPELVADWLRVIAAQELPLAAIYLLPMVSTGLLDRLQIKTPNLLIAVQHAGGLRLTFLRDRQFRLSRLTRGDGSKTTDPVRLFAGEISNTRLYLHALRTATLDEHLTVLLLDRNDELEDVAEAIVQDNPALDCVRVGRVELATRLGMDPQLLSAAPDAMYLQLLGLKAPAGNIAPASATVGFRRYRVSRSVYAACASIAGIAAVWSIVNGWQTYRVNGQAAEIAGQIAVQNAQYEQMTRLFPPSPTTGANLKKAVEIAKAIRETSRDPIPMMALISQALGATPDVMLRELGWRYGRSDIQKGAEASTAASAPSGAPGKPAPTRHQSAYLSGEIRNFRGDYRAAIQTIEGLVERLRRYPSVAEVRTIRMPLNVSPKAVLSGNTLDADVVTGSAEFEIVVVLQPRV